VAGGIAVGIETTARRTFASALDWPGWCRSGRDEAAALAALAAAADRYARVARGAGVVFAPGRPADLAVAERLPGTATTAFGAPDAVFALDGRPTDLSGAQRLGALVRAAWDDLDRVAGLAPAELRRGPRGGGRDRDAIVAHVAGAEQASARRIGLRLPGSDLGAGAGAQIDALRVAIVEILTRASDGGPIPGGRWPARYAARRIAWHALDHAWEIEDRAGLA
jgi:hypothetical protein